MKWSRRESNAANSTLGFFPGFFVCFFFFFYLVFFSRVGEPKVFFFFFFTLGSVFSRFFFPPGFFAEVDVFF